MLGLMLIGAGQHHLWHTYFTTPYIPWIYERVSNNVHHCHVMQFYIRQTKLREKNHELISYE